MRLIQWLLILIGRALLWMTLNSALTLVLLMHGSAVAENFRVRLVDFLDSIE